MHVEDGFLPTSGYQLPRLSRWNSKHGCKTHIVTSSSLEAFVQSGFISSEYMSNLQEYDDDFSQRTGVGVTRIKSFGSVFNREIFNYRALFSAVEDMKPDLVMVHGNDTLTGMLYALFAPRLKYPVIFDNHMTDTASHNPYRDYFRKIYRTLITPRIQQMGLMVIGVSEDATDYCRRYYAIPEHCLATVSLGTDTELFVPNETARACFRRRHGFADGDFVVLYTGKWTVDKKLELLAHAWQRQIGETRQAHLIVVGSGSGQYCERVNALLSASENGVHLFPTQPVEALVEFYQGADVAVWPGGCSLSTFDAMSCGLPVVLEGISPNRERISSWVNGLLFDPDNVQSLREALTSLLIADNETLRRMGAESRARAERVGYDNIATSIELLMHDSIRRHMQRNTRFGTHAP